MNCLDVHRMIESQIPNGFSCHVDTEKLALVTPFTYPDGDSVEVFVYSRPSDGRMVLTDLGETVRYLAGHGVSISDSNRRDAIVQDICATAEVFFRDGMLVTLVPRPDEFTSRLLGLGQTIVRVADMVYTAKSAVPVPFKDEVREYVSSAGLEIVSQKWISDHLDKYKLPYRPDFGYARRNKVTVVKALSSLSPRLANDQVSKVIRLWHYMKTRSVINEWQRLTIIDDSTGIWQDDWITQMQDLSPVIRWAEDREQLDGILTG